MAGEEPLIGARAFERGIPAASDAIAFAGGIGISVGALLLSIDFYGHGHGRVPGVALFAVMIAVGYLALGLLPGETHPAAVTMIVVGVIGTLGWWILPKAHSFSSVRPFLILVILALAACWLAPRTRGRTIFVAVALIVLWLWILGEVVGTDAYSAAPVPSPPPHTLFSLSSLTHSRAGDVTLGDLDPSSPLYPIASECDFDHGSACDTLFIEAPAGSNFRTFADTCGNAQPAGSGGRCESLSLGGNANPFPITGNPSPFGGNLVPNVAIGAGSRDKSLEVGFVSTLFGVAYLGALFALDRRRWRGLGTALVIPALLALFTGTEALGNAAHHAWVGGFLTFVAGVTFALVGDLGGRRFTTWVGAIFAAFGAYVFGGDIANIKTSVTGENLSLVKPALIAIAFGAILVVLALVVASMRNRLGGPTWQSPSTPTPGPPPFETGPAGMPSFPPTPPPAGPPGGPATGPPPFDFPTTPPPSAPWQAPPPAGGAPT